MHQIIIEISSSVKDEPQHRTLRVGFSLATDRQLRFVMPPENAKARSTYLVVTRQKRTTSSAGAGI